MRVVVSLIVSIFLLGSLHLFCDDDHADVSLQQSDSYAVTLVLAPLKSPAAKTANEARGQARCLSDLAILSEDAFHAFHRNANCCSLLSSSIPEGLSGSVDLKPPIFSA